MVENNKVCVIFSSKQIKYLKYIYIFLFIKLNTIMISAKWIRYCTIIKYLAKLQ